MEGKGVLPLLLEAVCAAAGHTGMEVVGPRIRRVQSSRGRTLRKFINLDCKHVAKTQTLLTNGVFPE